MSKTHKITQLKKRIAEFEKRISDLENKVVVSPEDIISDVELIDPLAGIPREIIKERLAVFKAKYAKYDTIS